MLRGGRDPRVRAQAEVARGDQAAADRKFRDWARSLHPDGEYINTHSVIQKRHVLFGTMKVRAHTVPLLDRAAAAPGGLRRPLTERGRCG